MPLGIYPIGCYLEYAVENEDQLFAKLTEISPDYVTIITRQDGTKIGRIKPEHTYLDQNGCLHAMLPKAVTKEIRPRSSDWCCTLKVIGSEPSLVFRHGVVARSLKQGQTQGGKPFKIFSGRVGSLTITRLNLDGIMVAISSEVIWDKLYKDYRVDLKKVEIGPVSDVLSYFSGVSGIESPSPNIELTPAEDLGEDNTDASLEEFTEPAKTLDNNQADSEDYSEDWRADLEKYRQENPLRQRKSLKQTQ